MVCTLLLITCTGITKPILAQVPEYRQQEIAVEDVTRRVQLPAGYTLEILTTELDGPRLLSFAANGDLFIGSKSGKVYRLVPPYTRPEVLVTLDNYPHSVTLRRNEILIAQTDGIYHAPYRPGQARVAPESVTRLAALPGGGGHSSRTVGIGPDERVYVSLGISGNCSDQYLGADYPFKDRRGGILVLNEDGDEPRLEPFASGLRNPVGFDWHPQSGVLYASNNGPDHLGFEQPREYFSRVEAGSFHGMPWFQFDGQRVRRDSCVTSQPPRPLSAVSIPVATFPARNAPMAVAFVPAGALDAGLVNDAVVALRGSWGTQPSGKAWGNPATRRPPKLVRVRFEDTTVVGVDDLVTGFQLADGERWARPVGVAIGPDGALYFTSDSGAQALFRLRLTP
ncbi:MAG: sugar dehydrogenase [Halobacteria archaeon]|nr:sugar dehydrogenase [Halobacteria archaeon]